MRAAGFNNPLVGGGFDLAPTSPAIEPTKRIDFIWARGLEAKDAQVLDSLASDHRIVRGRTGPAVTSLTITKSRLRFMTYLTFSRRYLHSSLLA